MVISKERLNYMSVARTALALAMRLEKIEKQKNVGNNIEKIKSFVSEFEKSSLSNQGESIFPLLKPEGLRIAIYASSQKYGNTPQRQVLQRLRKELKIFITNYDAGDNVKVTAREFKNLFIKIHDYADEAAIGTVPELDVDKAIKKLQ
jgi:hypothetical protein